MDPRVGLDLDAATRLCAASFEHHRARLELPSLAWGLVRDGSVQSGGDVDAVYRIASMTKSFTAATVLMLRDAGRLGLDDPVERYAPELAALRSPLPGAPPVTVRHLLTMSSGLATDDAWADRHLDLRDDELDAIVGDGVTFAWMPGITFEYSNLGYGVLGRVVRNITGSTLQRNVTDRILEPLGMTRTSWTAPDDAVPGYRTPHDGGALVVEPMLGDGAIAPMGGLFSSVTDLARWVDFLASAFGPPHAVHDALLSAASRREMQQAARTYPTERSVTTGAWSQRGGGYGYGLNVLPHPTLGTVVTHSGGLPGFGSNMRWVASTGVGLVALSNSTYAPMSPTTDAVLDALATAGAVTSPPLTASPALVEASQRLVAMLNGAATEAMFADNVDLDEPPAERRRVAAGLLDHHGPFRLARVFAESATSAVAIAHGTGVELHIDFQLAPITASLIQTYDITVVA
ncbi:MAG: serine hydrolase domain-containing protein [Ilumatobacteraceae bacterium]